MVAFKVLIHTSNDKGRSVGFGPISITAGGLAVLADGPAVDR